MNEICDPLFDMLRQHDKLEKEIFERNEQLNIEKAKAGIPKHIVAPGWDELTNEYRQRMYALLMDRCTDKLLSHGYGCRFGKPQEFSYLDEECTALFKMRYPDKASVETHYIRSTLRSKHKFVIRLIDGKWLLDEYYYGFGDEKTWYKYGF